ncbi:hypothetical protein [Spiroplasma tabanidicola]|uniref:Uncharacterized protein n=1 Tax=Spiroplasma tabanidicola TaxID=324079 RepID=A0A6I6C4C3_9MOLU|nr:hypothetical protein [Spiroplasma tabanidicola]QGS51687.1 hypothetical protein STABA_v1c03240 [Spiroplasma tabanidicola]
MRELTNQEKHDVIGGAGITGALFSGIASIFKSIGSFFTDTINTGVTAGLAYKYAGSADEFEYKNGSSSFKFSKKASISAKNDLDKKALDIEAKTAESFIPVAPVISFN